VAAALAVAAIGYYLFIFGVRPGPPFIKALQSGQVRQEEVTQIEVLRFTPIYGWPFRESDYSKMQRVAISDRGEIDRILSALRTNSSFGIQPRNHPGTLHWGILRIELQSGQHCYLYYQVERDQTGDFVSVDANSIGSSNPNGGKYYESAALVSLLRRDDPWFTEQ